MIQKLKDAVTAELEEDSLLWAVSFVGVCVLVGLGKLKPETVELMLFAVIGRKASKRNNATSQ